VHSDQSLLILRGGDQYFAVRSEGKRGVAIGEDGELAGRGCVPKVDRRRDRMIDGRETSHERFSVRAEGEMVTRTARIDKFEGPMDLSHPGAEVPSHHLSKRLGIIRSGLEGLEHPEQA